ncbi:MAG: hypothetical protein IKX03_03165 [Bacteroidales bacterium]|nr:hypothetical protein [Bacteroidales bacterium]
MAEIFHRLVIFCRNFKNSWWRRLKMRSGPIAFYTEVTFVPTCNKEHFFVLPIYAEQWFAMANHFCRDDSHSLLTTPSRNEKGCIPANPWRDGNESIPTLSS